MIAYDPNGESIYGCNSESSEFGLRRIAVGEGGLEEKAVVPRSTGFPTRTIDIAPRGLLLDRALYRMPDLDLLGTVNVDGGRCRVHSVPNRLVCSMGNDGSRDGVLAVVDATTFVIVATPAYRRGSGSELISLVPGPVGQVAIRTNTASMFGNSADRVSLFNSPALQ